jgi:hypothetical protein
MAAQNDGWIAFRPEQGGIEVFVSIPMMVMGDSEFIVMAYSGT